MADDVENTQSSITDLVNLKKYGGAIEKIPPIIGAISALSLVMSVIHDWGYFMALGIPFAEAPTSLSDHIKSTLIWMPPAFLGAYISFGFDIICSCSRTKQDGNERCCLSLIKKIRYFLMRSLLYVLIAFAVIIVLYLSYLCFNVMVTVIVVSISIILGWLNEKLFYPNRLKNNIKIFRLTFGMIPILLVTIWGAGYGLAKNNTAEQRKEAKLFLINDNENPISVRTFTFV